MQSTTLGILKCLCAGILLVACIPGLPGELPAPEQATILAQTRIRIGAGTHVADGVLVCNGVTSDSLIFDQDSSTGEIVVVYADTVTLRERVIAGVIVCNELRAAGSSAIAHRRFGVPIPVVDNPLSAARMTAAGAENIDVSARQVRVISAGNYDQITVGAGATVRFTRGAYHANTLLTGPNSRLEFVGAVHLWIDRRLQIGPDCLVNAQFPPAPLAIEVTSQEPVIIGARAIVQVASMSAPSAMIRMNDGVSFAGVIHADAVVTGNDCMLQTIDLRTPSVEAIPATGIYTAPITVDLRCDEPADIYYTIDGSEPDFYSILYRSPIVITGSTVLSFFAADQIGHRSATKRERYVIRSPASLQGGVGFQPATSHIDDVIRPAPDRAEAAPQTLAAPATADSSTTAPAGEEMVIDIGGKQTAIEPQTSSNDISISENSTTASLRTTAQPTNEEQPIPTTSDPKIGQRSISNLPSVIIPLTAGWNLISTPLEPADPVAARRGLPAKVVWQWRNGDYAVAAELHAHVGYWLELGSAMNLTISGSPAGDTVALTAGWNLIGPADEIPLPTHPAVIGVIWWWDGIRYQPAERLLPKKGYWIYALTDATLRVRGDTTLPVIAITGVTDGQRTNQPVTPIVAVTDNDSILSVSSILNNQPFISGATINVDGKYTLSVTATDATGNVATAVRQFTIDRTPPTLVCPLPRQIMLSSTPANGCGVPSDGNALTTWFESVNATDLCDPVTISHNEHAVYVVGLTMITFTAQDRCGNQTSCQSTITVVDDVNPTAVCHDATLQLSETGTVSLFPSLIDGNTADACGLSDLSVHPSSFSCPDVGVNSVTLTAIDIHGNSATCQAAVVVSDATAPTLHGLPDNQTVECNQIPESVAVTATDGCDGDLAVSFSETAQNLQSPCAPIAIGSPTIITRTWTATDRSGNVATASQTITVVDTVSPVVTVTPSVTNISRPGLTGEIDDSTAAITVRVGQESPAYTATNQGDGTWLLAAGVIGPFLADGTYNVQVIATDPFGNSASNATTGELTIDTTPPVITISGVFDGQLTNQPVSPVIAVTDLPFVSFVPFVVTLNDFSFESGTLITTDGIYTLSADATDLANNRSTRSLDFTIDHVPPVLTVPLDQTMECPADTRPEVIGVASGTDSCGSGVVAISYVDETQSECGATKTIIRRWTGTDECGNAASAVQTITVADTIPPSLSCPLPISVTLGDAGPMTCSVDDTYAPLASWLNTAITADVCGSVAVTNDHPSTFPVGTTTVTFTATDECENVTACSSSVTLIDNVPPVAVCRDVTIHLDSVGHAAVTADHINSGSTDACGIATVGLDRQTFACADAGMNAVALTVADLSGNIASCNGSITVVDETAPFVVAHDLVVQLDAAGVASIMVADIDSGTSDACGLSVLSVLPSSFTCANVGANTVTLTAVDVNGNTASSTAIVTVEDRILPSAVCREATVNLSETGTVSISSSLIDGNSSDVCGLSDLSISPSSFSCDDVGPNTVTLTAIDIHGNASTCQTVVTVTDDIVPSASVNDLTVQLDANGDAAITVEQIDNGSHDNCGIASTQLDHTTFGCDDVGSNAVTMTVTDDHGNSSTAMATVTVEDRMPPTAVCKDIMIQLDEAGTVSLAASAVGNGSDACGIVALTVNRNTFTCADIGANTVVFTATDVNGNSASCESVVTVRDEILPTVLTRNIAIQLDATGTATITTGDVDSGTSDSCGLSDLSVLPSSFTCADVGANTVTLTAVDVNGNTASSTAIVTVEDRILPSAVCREATVNLSETGTVSISSSLIDGNSSDVCGLSDRSISPSSFSCDDVGPNTVTLTATDVHGNTATCQAVVTVNDGIVPIAAAKDVRIQLDAGGNAAITVDQVDSGSRDNCGIASMQLDRTTFDCDNVGSNAVTMTVTDSHGNVSTATATVTVEDRMAPIVVTQDVTIQLDAAGSATIAPTDIDDGTSDVCGIASLSLDVTDFTCANIGANTVTLSAVDIHGNTASATATVAVEDRVSPTAACQDITIQLDEAGAVSLAVSAIGSGTDACGIATLTLDRDAFTCANIGANTVTLSIADVNGNNATCTAVVTVEDKVVPIAACRDITVQLDSDGAAAITAGQVNNGSADACGIAALGLDRSTFTCSDIGSRTVTLTATDVHGNNASCQANVTVVDTVSPIAVCRDAIVTLNSDGAGTLAADAVNNDVADACGITSITAHPSEFTCANIGANTVTLTVTDVTGNSGGCTSVVTVKDEIVPTVACRDIAVHLDANGTVVIAADQVNNGSMDACGIASLSVTPNTFTCATIGANTATLTVTDIHGNVSMCEAAVTVEDRVAPTALCRDVTVQLDPSGAANILATAVDAGSHDACGISALSVSPSSFSCADVGPSTVTLTATDVHGNTATCQAVVTLTDDVLPNASAKDVTIKLDAGGNAAITVDQVDNGSRDNCGIASMQLDRTTFDCDDVGSNAVIMTVTDNHGNISAVTATVTVEDRVTPIMVTQDIMIQLDAAGSATITPSNIDNGSSDVCGIASLSLDVTDFTCANVGANTVNLTAVDGNGNTASATATVTVEDRIAPILATQDVTIQLDAAGLATIAPTDIDDGTSDVCGIASLSLDITEFTCANVGANTVTLTAVDGNGNTASATATVAVEDRVPPTAACQDITIRLDEAGGVSLAASAIGSGTDACGIAALTLDRDAFACTDIGANNVTLTATDVTGNSGACTAMVTVQDEVAPEAVCRDVTVQLDATGAAILQANQVNDRSTDACGIATLALSRNAFTCADVGANAVSLTVSDTHGNNTACMATVTVEDTIAPVAACRDITVQLDNDGNARVFAGTIGEDSTDACGIADLTLERTAFDCGAVGANTVTLSATDANGNNASCTAIITVEDRFAPTVLAKNITVRLDATGNAAITAQQLDTGSHDACGILSLSLNLTDFTCANIGANPITLTATDVNGNSATAAAIVTVEDHVPPLAVCQDITVQLDSSGAAAITTTELNNGSADACGLASLTLDRDAFTCDDIGSHSVTLTATDVNGNSATCTATVVVRDVTAPILRGVPDDQTVECHQIPDSAPVTAADGCDGDLAVSYSESAENLHGTCVPIVIGSPTRITRTWTATDRSGNVATASQLITVVDTVSPVVTVTPLVTNISRPGLTGEIDDSTAAITVRVGQESPAYTATNHGDGTWSLAAGVIDPALADGTHNVRAVATDPFGNSASNATTGELTIDTARPVITISGVTDNLLTNQPVTPIIAVTDPPFVSFVHFVVTLNDFSFESGTPVITDGHYSLTVLANDLAGNTSRRSMDFAIDTTPPAITIAAPLPDLVTNRLDARLEGTITDAHLADLLVNGAAVTVASDGSFSSVASLPKEGSNSITIGAKDRLGQTTTVQRTIVRDTMGPTLAVDGSAAPRDTNLATVVFTGTVDASTIRVSARGVDAIPAIGRFTIEAPLSEGANRIRIVAVDVAGNQSVVDRDVNRDTRAPTISVRAPSPAFLTNTPSTVVRGTVDDATAIVSVNSATVALAAGAFAREVQLVEGDNVVRVHAADRADNTAVAEISGRLDRHDPQITIQSPADGFVTRAGAVTVSGTVDDPAAEVAVNGHTVALANDSFQTELTLPGASGNVDIVVTARDPAGNAATQTTHVVRDVTPPIVTVLTPAEHQVLIANTATIQGDVDDNTATVTVNGVTATVSNRRFTLTGLLLAQGNNTLVAVATDAVGNRSAEVTRVVTVDTIAPVAPVVDAVPAFINTDRISLVGTAETGATITALGGLVARSIVADDAGRFTIAVLLTPNATSVLELTARDTAGNVGAPTTVTVVSDLVPPTLVLTSPIAWDAITTWEGQSVPRLFSPFLAVSGYAVDASSIASLQINNQAVSLNADGTFVTVLNLQPGFHSLSVHAADLAGNVAEIRFDVELVDSAGAPPVISVYSPLYDDAVSGSSITILAAITDASGIAAVRIQGSALNPLAEFLHGHLLTAPATINANGEVVLEADDSDGFTTSITHRVVLDDDVPAAPVVNRITPGAITNHSPVTIHGTAEPRATIELRLLDNVGGALRAATVSPDSVGQYAIGIDLLLNQANSIELRARDTAGNISPSTVVEIGHDSDPPAVVSVVPSDDSVGVPPSSTITVTFSELIHSDTLAGIMLEAVPPGDSISFSLQSSILNSQFPILLTPSSPFSDSARVTLTIPTTVTDLAGNALQSPFISSFTVLDTTAPAPPTIDQFSSVANHESLIISGTAEPNAYVEAQIPDNVGGALRAATGQSDSAGRFNFAIELILNQLNSIEVTAIDSSGNQSQPAVVSITHDSVSPSVLSVVPSSGAVNVSVGATITITFSESLDADSVAGITWEAVPPGDSISFSIQSEISNQQSKILLTPSSLIPGDTTYSVAVPTTIRDRAGNSLAAPFTSTFTTVDNVPPASPILDAIPALTRHSSLVISGFSTPGTQVNVDGALGAATVDVGSTGLFSLSISLAPNTHNQLQISARDTAGNQSPAISRHITQDSTTPQVVKTIPAEGEAITPSQSVFLEFSEPLDPSAFVHAGGDSNVGGASSGDSSAIDPIQIFDSTNNLVTGQFFLSASGKSVTFFPDHQLLPDSDYGILMSRDILDLAGNALAESVTINFTTVAPATINRALAPKLTVQLPPITQDSAITVTGFLPSAGSMSDVAEANSAGESQFQGATISVLGGISAVNAAVHSDGTFSIVVPLSADQENTLVLYATVSGVDGEVTTFTVRHTSHPPGIRILTPQAGVVYHNLSVTVMGIIDSPEFVDVSSIRVEGETVGLFGNYFARQIVFDTPGEKIITATGDSQISNLQFQISSAFSLSPQSSGPDTQPPLVKIVYPESGFTANRRFIELMGTVEEGVALSSVTCAGVPAHAVLGNIFLVYSELTHQGANEITVVARDQAGLVGQDSLTIFLDDSVPPMPVLAESPALVQQRIHRLTGSAGPGETVVVRGGLTTVRTVVSSDGSYVLSVPLVPNSRNTLTLISLDAADNESDPVEVAIVHDDQAPRVTATSPEAGATGVAPNARVVITFSEPLASAILNQQSAIQILNFLHQPIPGSILLSAGNTVATFIPSANFQRNDSINVFLHSDITDANGFTLGLPYSFSFQIARLQTTVSGVVVDPDLQPLAGILVGLLSSNPQSTITNAFGAFVIDDAPVGDQILFINPTDSSLLPFAFSYPYLEFAITVTENTDNSLGRPIFLVPLDFSTLANVGGSSAGDSSQFPGISDFSLSLAPGSVRFPDGSSTGNIVATRILPEFIPDRLPDGSIPHFLVHLSGVGFQPASSASSAQSAISAEQSETGSTGGASNEVANQESKITFSPAASLTFPNVYDLAAGEKVLVFHFQHGIHNYTELGEAEVGANGLITTDLILYESGFIGIIPADSSFDLTKNYLRGRVIGPDGEGLSDVAVHAIAGFTEVRTDDNGEYLIPLPDVRVFQIRTYASIPSALGDSSNPESSIKNQNSKIRNELIFPSALVSLNPSGITEVPDIVIDTIILSGSIRFIDAAGDKLPRTGLAFHEGNLVSLDDATARAVKIFIFRQSSAGNLPASSSSNVGSMSDVAEGSSAGDSSSDLRSLSSDHWSLYASTTASLDPFSLGFDASFSLPLVLNNVGSMSDVAEAGSAGDSSSNPQSSILKVVAFSPSTGWYAEHDLILPSPSSQSEISNLQSQILLDLRPPQLDLTLSRVFFLDGVRHRAPVPDGGIVFTSDEFVEAKVNWTTPDAIAPVTNQQSEISNQQFPISIPARLQIDSVNVGSMSDVAEGGSADDSSSALRPLSSDLFFSIHGGEHPYILELREALVPDRLTILQRDTDVGTETFTFSPGGAFAENRLLSANVGGGGLGGSLPPVGSTPRPSFMLWI